MSCYRAAYAVQEHTTQAVERYLVEGNAICEAVPSCQLARPGKAFSPTPGRHNQCCHALSQLQQSDFGPGDPQVVRYLRPDTDQARCLLDTIKYVNAYETCRTNLVVRTCIARPDLLLHQKATHS